MIAFGYPDAPSALAEIPREPLEAVEVLLPVPGSWLGRDPLGPSGRGGDRHRPCLGWDRPGGDPDRGDVAHVASDQEVQSAEGHMIGEASDSGNAFSFSPFVPSGGVVLWSCSALRVWVCGSKIYCRSLAFHLAWR